MEENVASRTYLLQQAKILLRLAKSINNPQAAAALVEKAADFKSQVDDQGAPPDVNAVAPDVQRPAL
jgi:hypothetical protein